MINAHQSRNRVILPVILFGWLLAAGSLGAEEMPAVTHAKELVSQAWVQSGQGDYEKLNATVDLILKQYELNAKEQGAALQGFPSPGQEEVYGIMNAVATACFIRAEALMHQGKNEQAIAAFKALIRQYPYARAWDPSRGAFWKIADKSQISMGVMMGVEEKATENIARRTMPVIVTPGTDKVVDYSRYGVFSGIGTKDFKYQIKDSAGLSQAVGEGIYPNSGDIYKNPRYAEVFKEGRLNGSHWDFVNTADLEAAYLKWASAPEDPGVKLFYLGCIFQKAKMFTEALKAYHALIVNFPGTVSWTYWHTAWYPAQVAVFKIKYILRMHPELNLRYEGGKIQVIREGGRAGVISRPGVIQAGVEKKQVIRKNLGKPVRSLGGNKTRLMQYANGHWRMFVDGKPFIIKGITYVPTKVGESPDNGTLANWMEQDSNHDGILDAPYQAYVDRNDHNKDHPDEVAVGDFQLLKEMGVNALRLYHQPLTPVKSVLRDLYSRYGIGVLMGDYLGKYTVGSGAEWAAGTDYENPVHQANMMTNIEAMVREYKDEPYVLLWVLGNENNYGVACNADIKPDAFYQFANKVAKRIKEIDPTRPVALVNGDALYIEKFAALAPDIDIFSANVYRGEYGLGAFWEDVHRIVNKPVYITEFGAPGYAAQDLVAGQAEEEQALYDKGNWLDIAGNAAGYQDGEGNSIGGVAFEWVDEWYKDYTPARHSAQTEVTGPFPGGYFFEEWFGITGQGDGKHSPFLRHLKKAYFMYKELWRQGNAS
ncbi:MAG: glycoside hydrolase family 2 TIM barrel-domain containing protein [Candidatus Omnitrophota bacterium]